jgi:hypothetical protein
MISTGCILVAYDFDDRKQKLWNAFLNRSRLINSKHLVVDNGLKENFNAIKGSNEFFEFSGYIEGIEALASKDLDQIFIFNDTLFEHHATMMWANFFKNISPEKDGIFGDGRIEPVFWDGSPLKILASWHFLLNGKASIEDFSKILKDILDDFDMPLVIDNAYKLYREKYLSGGIFNGYSLSGKLNTEEDMLRKKKCIDTEHRLGRKLEKKGKMNFYFGYRYQFIHGFDRFLSFYRRFKSKLGL